MPEDEADLSFADFDAPKRPYTAPIDEEPSAEPGNYLEEMARREGFADSLCSLVESTSAEQKWHAGRDSNPRPSGSKN